MRALSRKKANRESLLRNLATSLVLYERIETTEAKAKELKPIVEHLIVIAKKNDLASYRALLGYFFDKNAVKKVMEVLVPRFKNIQSGFIKTYRKGNRLGDGAMIMILQLQKGDIKEEIKELNTESKDGTKEKSSTGKEVGKETKSGKTANNSRTTK